MREILFRGKSVDTNEWVMGDYTRGFRNPNTEQLDNLIYMFSGKTGEWNYNYAFVDPETVGQYTGLTDKNGTKIFEGDILAFLNVNQKEHIEGVVKYGNFNCGCCDGVYGWYIENGDIRNLEENSYIHMYVKGNIHDNPELLKGGVDE